MFVGWDLVPPSWGWSKPAMVVTRPPGRALFSAVAAPTAAFDHICSAERAGARHLGESSRPPAVTETENDAYTKR